MRFPKQNSVTALTSWGCKPRPTSVSLKCVTNSACMSPRSDSADKPGENRPDGRRGTPADSPTVLEKLRGRAMHGVDSRWDCRAT